MTTTADQDINLLIAAAKGTVPASVYQRLTAAGRAIDANPDLPIRDLLDILSPRRTAPQMSAAQAARLDRIHADAHAAVTTISHWVTDTGSVVVVDTDADGQTATAVMDRDGNLRL